MEAEVIYYVKCYECHNNTVEVNLSDEFYRPVCDHCHLKGEDL